MAGNHVMPELPEGYYWKIKPFRNWIFGPGLTVELRRNLFWGMSERVSYLWFETKPTPEANAEKCVDIGRRLKEAKFPAVHELDVNGLQGARIAKGVKHS